MEQKKVHKTLKFSREKMAKKKYLRVETIYDTNDILLIDELNRYYATIDSDDFFGSCCGQSQRFEDDKLYWLTDLEEVEKYRK